MRNEFQKFHIGLKAIIKCNSEILLIKTASRGHWEVPGGRIDKAENCDAVLAREIFEETGMKLDLTNKRLVHVSNDTYKGYAEEHDGIKLCLIFYEIEIDSKPDVKVSHEHSEYQWININDSNNLTMMEEIKLAIKQIKI